LLDIAIQIYTCIIYVKLSLRGFYETSVSITGVVAGRVRNPAEPLPTTALGKDIGRCGVVGVLVGARFTHLFKPLYVYGSKGMEGTMVKPQENKMKTMKDYLNAVSEKWQCKSENDLAHLLGISRQALLQFRQGRTKYFKPRTVYRIAQLLNIEPEELLISHQIISAENDVIKKTWEKVFTKITKHAAGIAFAAFSATESVKIVTLYIMSNIFMSRPGMKPA
jgi:transcriptional regulator with XRE-family HTH domain